MHCISSSSTRNLDIYVSFLKQTKIKIKNYFFEKHSFAQKYNFLYNYRLDIVSPYSKKLLKVKTT